MFKNSVEIFDVLGFKLKVDPSWLLIAALIIWSLSNAYFPDVVPGLSTYDYVALATVSMLGLFASLILHELAHSLVARQFGLRVGSITLFVFGGVAELEQEPENPKSEFWIALAGPAMSFALAAMFEVIARSLTGLNVSQPLTAVFSYLAWINMILALFNLVPAFPLDGGRIFRALLWRYKRDIFVATRVASAFGTAFGSILIVLGIIALFASSSVSGLWQILIGFFVVSASRSAYQHLLVSAALSKQTVRSLMTKVVHRADVDDSVQSVIDDIMLKHNVSFVPVCEGDHLLGYVSPSVLENIERSNRQLTKVGDLFVKADQTNTVGPDTPTESVFEKMMKTGMRKMLVTENGKLIGLLALSDLMTFLSIQSGLGMSMENQGHTPSRQHPTRVPGS